MKTPADNGIAVAVTARKFLVRLGDGRTLHTVPHRHILQEHLTAGSAIELVLEIFAMKGNDAQHVTDERNFHNAPLVAGPFAPAHYRTLPDGSRHLRINVGGVAQWHHCPSPERLQALLEEARKRNFDPLPSTSDTNHERCFLPFSSKHFVLSRLDEAVKEYDNSVLRAMARTMAA